MGIVIPKIEQRNFEDLLKEFKSLIPFYTPEWRPKEKSADLALVKIFIYLLSTLYRRLNRLPEKHFISFLDSIGINLLPAQPASAPITFSLSGGASQHVIIPARAQVAAGEVIFETEKTILAAPAQLVKVYSIDVQKDAIFESPPNISSSISEEAVLLFETKLLYNTKQKDKEIFVVSTEGLQAGDLLTIGEYRYKTEPDYAFVSDVSDSKVILSDKLENVYKTGEPVKKITIFEPFKGKNLQEHILYLGHEDVFNINSRTELEIFISTMISGKTGKPPGKWQYWGTSAETGLSDWYDFAAGMNQESGGIVLVKDNDDEIAEAEVNGITSRWIRWKIDDLEIAAEIDVDKIEIAAGGREHCILPDMAFRNDVPVNLALDDIDAIFKESLYPFGKKPAVFNTFYIASSEAFSKKGKKINLRFSITRKSSPAPEVPVTFPLIDVFGLGETFMSRLNAAGITTLNEFLSYSVDELMKIMQTNQRLTVINVKRAAKIQYIETSKLLAAGLTLDEIAAGKGDKEGYGDDIPVESSPTGEEKDEEDLTLSWEYWDGKGWSGLNVLVDGTDRFLLGGTHEIIFKCPENIEKINVNGQENYWCRVRIVHGDYGKEKLVDQSGTWVLSDADIDPPVIHKLTISYDSLKQTPNQCLAWNNLEFQDFSEVNKTPGKTFKPFVFVSPGDMYRALYLGFDRKLEKGPIILFFSIEEQLAAAGNIPRLSWEYYSGEGKWVKPQVLDKTDGLTKSGEIEFVFSDDFKSKKKFGRELFWLRALDIDDYFSGANAQSLIPRIKGIYLNSTWAVQCETVKEEILGSSDGTSAQVFTLKKTPVISGSEDIWVNEVKALSGDERKRILEEEIYQAREVKDEKEDVVEFWVKWKATENLLSSSEQQRHYELDNVSGEVKFGDGIYGRIPPTGTDNIKAGYRSGGGKKGNLAAFGIKDLKTSLPFLDKAYNPIPARGGTDTETVERALERGPYLLKHRNRAVTAEDFEKLAYQASGSGGIARVKCLPNVNNQRRFEPGWVTVIIIPQSQEPKPRLSLQLKRQVENYLEARAVNVLAEENHILVTDPIYVELSVFAHLAAVSTDAIPLVENASYSRLKEFLNPLSGGNEQKGWEFGKVPCFSDFYALLEKIEGVDHVKDLSIKLKITEQDTLSEYVLTPENPEDFYMPPDALVCSGEHKVKVSL
ncbi:MAG: putative baseplate assembly protein [Candidatus Aminicenantes bacterium]|nr:putative baseplate assembly protein [Candidatus Aminicenantes bacterium]NIM80163.1 putative baseplate assembly protein [Candidatus Aminicenantes bacterium]NIN19499.1 putative baseplate assembly protein [Candidatus Aminicenantes bacterium]NIN43398.1 putative baseplate assembly protein [Candidatus Aminicenantes bacterium]NIN86143.1 putative baseplate assembly protein [Candidatus Aminicenantes bacterium]